MATWLGIRKHGDLRQITGGFWLQVVMTKTFLGDSEDSCSILRLLGNTTVIAQRDNAGPLVT